jgi:GTP-binding protein LepA
VSRSFAACQGALLLVDATEGVQAQTVANYELAINSGLKIIPIISKVDLPHADPYGVAEELEEMFGMDLEEILMCSSKTGEGIGDVLPRVIDTVDPPVVLPAIPDQPESASGAPPVRKPVNQSFLFDLWYDLSARRRGVVLLVLVQMGKLQKDQRIRCFHSNNEYEVQEVGVLTPRMIPVDQLAAGQVGYVLCNIRTPTDAWLGDTLFGIGRQGTTVPAAEMQAMKELVRPMEGFAEAKNNVFSGVFPVGDASYEKLLLSIEKLQLNDPSVQAVPEFSASLGQGFRCGFLGLLHMDVFITRLKQEFDMDVITTAPTVRYEMTARDKDTGEMVDGIIDSPGKFPEAAKAVGASFREPWIHASMLCPKEFLGPIVDLSTSMYRGQVEEVKHISPTRVQIKCDFPAAEVMVDFYDRIKSASQGYCSFDYEQAESRVVNLIKLEVRVNMEPVDALSVLCPKEGVSVLARKLVEKLRKTITRQSFEINIQAVVGTKVMAKSRIAPYRKDVLTKSGKTVGGGDMTRKKKLLEKQKDGKKRMKTAGNVEISQEALLSVLSV